MDGGLTSTMILLTAIMKKLDVPNDEIILVLHSGGILGELSGYKEATKELVNLRPDTRRIHEEALAIIDDLRKKLLEIYNEAVIPAGVPKLTLEEFDQK